MATYANKSYRLNNYQRYPHSSGALLGCSKLLLFSLVLVLAGQLHLSSLLGKASYAVSANDECQDFEIIKPPRFGKRDAYLDNYDKCNEKRKANNSYSNRQRNFLNLLTYLALHKDKPKYQSLIKLYLSKTQPLKMLDASDNLRNVFNGGNSPLALETLEPNPESTVGGAEVITKVVRQEKQSSTKQVNNQSLNLIKRMKALDGRGKFGPGRVDANANGYFGIFHELQEYSHGRSFPNIASYLHNLVNKSQ